MRETELDKWVKKLEMMRQTTDFSNNKVATLDFSSDIDAPNKYQTEDGKWHTGMIDEDDKK